MTAIMTIMTTAMYKKEKSNGININQMVIRNKNTIHANEKSDDGNQGNEYKQIITDIIITFSHKEQ